MAEFELTSPEGKSYKVTGPAGSTKEQAFGILQQQLGGKDPPPAKDAAPSQMSWGDAAVSAVKNIPSSAGKFAHDLIQPIVHPIDTAESLKNLGLGVLQKIAPTDSGLSKLLEGGDYEKHADAAGKFLVDRYGSIDAVKKTLATDPVGLAGDLSLLLTGGGAAAVRAPGIVGKVGEAAQIAGRAIDPVVGAGKALKGVGTVASEVIGNVGTHTGGESLRTAARAGAEGGAAGKVFTEHMRGNAPLEEAVTMARDAVKQLRQERGTEYRASMSGVASDPKVLNFHKIGQAVLDAERVQTYKGIPLSPITEKIRNDMITEVVNWSRLPAKEFHTVEGMDALKKKLGNIKDGTQHGTPERVAADKIYNAVRGTITDQAPAYAKVMKGYEEASSMIKELERTLSLDPTARIDTALRKLQSILRNNVNTSYGHRAKLAEFLVEANAPHLMQALAGQALNTWTARGMGRLGAQIGAEMLAVTAGAHLAGPAGVGVLGSAAAMSPRLMGEAAYLAGQTSRYGEPLARGTYQAGRASRAASPKSEAPQ